MSLSITQIPASVSLAQSPMAFTVAESDSNLLTSSSFQYVGVLYYWQGGLYASSSNQTYTLTKYPNTSGVGIFDASKIINSTLIDLLAQNQSNVEYYAIDFYTQYLNSGAYITGSHVKSGTFRAIDGYALMGNNYIGESLNSMSIHWPLMTDGPVTQSVFTTDRGYAGVWANNTIDNTLADRVVYIDNTGTTGTYFITTSTSSSAQIAQYPQAPSEVAFPLTITNQNSYYTIQAYNGATPLGTKIKFEIAQQQKYENIRVGYKNRFGQFDYIDFYMQNRQTFSVTKRSYQPQLGSWNASSLSYQSYDSNNKNYIIDANQTIEVNSNWLPEEQNALIKQMMVSDEIYWFYDQPNSNSVKPLSIATSNVLFKTGVNDHLIQYAFTFNFGQSYKLIF
jgi:hypothetical protein